MNKNLPILLIIVFIFCANSIFAQKLFSVDQNGLLQENVSQIKNQISLSHISALSLTRNNENKEAYAIPLSSVENSKIIILNEETGDNVVITPVKELRTEFQLSPFFIEELKQATLGKATQYLIAVTGSDFSVKNLYSVDICNENIYIPRFFYGKKEDVKEALPKDRQIIGIYKQKPQLILADPDNLELQRYASQYEEENSYYVYMYKLPDGTRCTYDEHFNPKQEKSSKSSAGNFLEFNLTGELTERQRTATEYALELWSEQLGGTVPVDIEVSLFPLGEGVIGVSFFPTCFIDHNTDIMYPAALWNQLVGYDANDEWDIFIIMSSKFNFYFGLDGSTSGIDYVTIMLHEVTHGLGFGCYCDPDGYFFYDLPGTYDCQLFQGLTGPCFTELSVPERAALMVSNNLYAGRPNSNLLAANEGVRVKMYAPTRYSGGSTAHHWDTHMDFINFMQYAYQYPLHTFNDRKIGILTDMGWTTPLIDPNAVWVTFDANGGSGNRNPQPFSPGVPEKLKINSFAKKGYDYLQWNTEPDGTGTSYQNKESIVINQDVVLYAQWKPSTYTLTFNPVLGSVFPKSKQVVYDSLIGEMPIPVKPGYKFDGWKIGTKIITEETVWNYATNTTAMAKWSIEEAIDDTQHLASIQVFPNPTTGQFKVQSSKLNIKNIEIFDIVGKKNVTIVMCRDYHETLINISNLKSGIYFLTIETDNETITKKIIKL